MGYTRHHTIVVTDWREAVVQKAQELAVSLQMSVSSVHISGINSWYSFCVLPDGSNEGWEESDVGDKQRDALIVALEWNHIPYVCIEYGGDDRDKISIEHLSEVLHNEDDYSTEWRGPGE